MGRKINIISIIGAGYLGKQIIEKSLLFNYDIKAFDTNQEDLSAFTEKMRGKIKDKNLNATIIQYNNIINLPFKRADCSVDKILFFFSFFFLYAMLA